MAQETRQPNRAGPADASVQRGWLGYAAAIGFVLVAAVLRWLAAPILGDRFPLTFFFVAVLATGVIGELRHSFLAVALGLIGASYFVFSQGLSGARPSDYAGLGLFVVVGVAIALASARLRRTERDLTDFFDHSSVGLHWLDSNGTITRANQANLDLVGFSRDEYVGHHICEFQADQQVCQNFLRRVHAGERIKNFPARLRCKDGSTKEVLMDSSVVWQDGLVQQVRCFVRDVTMIKQAELASRRLAAIVESSNDAIISKSLTGIVQSWNKGAERLFGYSADEMIGQSITKLIPPERGNEEPAILARISRGEQVNHFETIRRRKDGELIHVSLSISPVRDAGGAVVGASKIARDITERTRLTAELSSLVASERAARTEAEQAARLRDDFLAVVSHELRTPLNAVFGWAQLLMRGEPDSTVRAQAVQAIEQSARAQAQLIDDLLDMNRIMSGKLHLDIQNLHLASVIESALQTMRPAAEAKSIRIQSMLATNIAPMRGDPARLQQVVWNLVSNAVKFTPKGGAVQVLLERVNSHLEISVADNGMGIQPAFLPHVFERFRQADSGTSRQYGGLGLGLAIVKQIVELHGGSVSAESRGEGQGATFHVRLPVSIVNRPASLEAEYAPSDPPAIISLAGYCILVVDDDPGGVEVVKRILEASAARVLTATSGTEALEIAATATPDVILSDIGMPVMDGYEFMRALRASGNTTPAIALTAFARPEDRIRTLAAGYTMHLSKPIDAQELFIVIQAVLRTTGRLVS